MKRLVLAGLTFAALTATPFSALADTFNTQRCINMGNALDAPSEGAWGHTIEADSFRRVAEAGFDTVRIPVRWSAHTRGSPDYKIDEPFFRRVTDVINQALAHDLQIILNIHHFEELNENPEANRVKFLALWDQIASRYQNLPDSVYFEIINEPNANFKGDLMRDIVTEAFEQIRGTNPTRILIMGGDNWSGINSLSTIPSIDDPNQVHTFHYYDPFQFTHQKASWTDLKNSGTVHWGGRADEEELKSAAEKAKQAQAELGIPIFLGEIGAYEKAPYEDIVQYTYKTRQAFEDAGISWCAWNFTATFPFYDSASSQWDELKLAALGLSPNGDPVELRLQNNPNIDSAESSLDLAIEELRRELGREAELTMSPEVETLGTYGPIETAYINDDTVPGGRALEITVARAATNPWDGGVSGGLTSDIKKGDTLVMIFWAKAIEGRGVISNVGLQRNKAPYSAIDQMISVNLEPTWKPYAVFIEADQDYGAMEAGYTFHLTNAAQTVHIGPVAIFNVD
jgi:endoglucanase